MSSTALTLAVGCVLHTAPQHVRGDVYKAVVVASPTCDYVDIPVAPMHTVTLMEARVRTSKGSRSLQTERIERRTRDHMGQGSIRVHTPELRDGDTLRLRYQRISTSAGDASTPERLPKHTVAPSDSSRHETLVIPYGDPQVALYPGGGATTKVILETTFPPLDESAVWTLPLPQGTTQLTHSTTPDRGADVFVRDDSLLVVVQPTETKVRVDLRWTQPDAATFGTVPINETTSIHVEDGLLGWSNDRRRWWLIGVHDEPVLPNLVALQRALTHRFDAARLREPALPPPLRGAPLTLELLQQLTTYVREQATAATWPNEPTLPRPIARAFREGAMTEIEAGLSLHALLQQAGFGSSWRLARPLDGSPEPDACLSGFEHLLIEVTFDDSTVWIDPQHETGSVGLIRQELAGGLWIGSSATGTVPEGFGSTHAQ